MAGAHTAQGTGWCAVSRGSGVQDVARVSARSENPSKATILPSTMRSLASPWKAISCFEALFASRDGCLQLVAPMTSNGISRASCDHRVSRGQPGG